MRPLRVLTISAALALAAALAPAMAQTANAPPVPADTQRPAATRIGINGSLLPSGDAPDSAQQSNVAPDADSSKDSDATKEPNAAKDPDPAKDATAPQFDHGAPAASAPLVAIPSADVKKATSILRRSTRDYAACTHIKTCSAYFDSFGVAFSFADGSIAAYSHEQRGPISGHDCVVKARNALGSGERSMAVQWMMAAQSDILNRNWIADHPDAMLEALRTFRGWA